MVIGRPIAQAPKIVGLAIDQTIVHNYTLIHIKIKELVHGYIHINSQQNWHVLVTCVNV
jgi:hypothetical protein